MLNLRAEDKPISGQPVLDLIAHGGIGANQTAEVSTNTCCLLDRVYGTWLYEFEIESHFLP
jgi:hypothetical protein